MRLSFDDSDDLMKELDRDGDGQIAYREFVKFLRDGGSSGGGRSRDPSPPRSSSSRSYKVADRVASELRKKFDAAIDAGKIKSYNEVFQAMDTNDDGRVSKREFERGLRDLRVSVCVCGCVCLRVCVCVRLV